MLICKEPESTFIHISKTGGQSIRKWIMDNGIMHEHPKGHPHHTGEDAGGFRYCVVRDPYRRALSAWLFFSIFRPGISFQQFLEGKMDPEMWFVKQVDYVKNCDLVLRFESLEEDFKQIQDLYGLYEPLPKVNDSKYEQPWKQYYTEQTYDLVSEIFKEDIEELDYNFRRN
jgi:hypothetical protein